VVALCVVCRCVSWYGSWGGGCWGLVGCPLSAIRHGDVCSPGVTRRPRSLQLFLYLPPCTLICFLLLLKSSRVWLSSSWFIASSIFLNLPPSLCSGSCHTLRVSYRYVLVFSLSRLSISCSWPVSVLVPSVLGCHMLHILYIVAFRCE